MEAWGAVVWWSDGQTTRLLIERMVVRFYLLHFVHTTLLLSFGGDTKSHWCLLSGIYVSKRSHAERWRKTCCGLYYYSMWTDPSHGSSATDTGNLPMNFT